MITPLLTVDIKVTDPLLNNLGGIPQRSTDGSAGYDVRACNEKEIYIEGGKDAIISTGFSLSIPSPYWSCIFIPRSGLGMKSGIIMGNSVGLIDSDYRGTCFLSVWNRNKETFTITPGMRIAQMVFMPVGLPDLNLVEELGSETDRGDGGLGSTGLG